MTDSARVVLATHSVLGRGGIGVQSEHIARMLVTRAAPSVVLSRGNAVDLPPSLVRVLPRPKWRIWLAGTRLRRLALRTQDAERLEFDAQAAAALPACDVVMAEDTSGLATLRRAEALGARRVLIHSNHAVGWMSGELDRERERFGGPPHFITAGMRERAAHELELAERVIVFSKSAKETVVGQGCSEADVQVARLGVDCDRFRPVERDPDAFVVAFVGWLDLRKGYPYLIEGFRKAAIPGSRLVLHGGSSLAFHHELVARLAGSADVRVVRGPVEPTFESASVVVLPSVSDAYGLSALEGMASGVPVIVSDRCGVSEDVRHGVDGFVVPARDAAALGERLVQLREDVELRERMGRAARESALTHPWSLVGDDVSSVIAGLAS